ncbi:MAG TPA: adenylate/guanylate cyclase domain-containing protein [Burkholderiaceae bacterium]|nr:adenylate/guanylate cyclase domain-containing protein [Burkholderiaceae bacterium]
MSSDADQLRSAIAVIEAQRPQLGDAVVELALAPLRAQLAALSGDTAADAPAQRLRQVTILFLDVVGFTRLSQRLDPEAIAAVMDDALARGTSIVGAHRGRVLQYAGDSILAVFGADEAREDDAERAVRCGLALLELGRALGAEVRAAHGHDGLNVRIGAHTGAVLLGGGVVDADGAIRGTAVNIAARMEQSAPPGGLRISHATYAQVRGMFEVEHQAPLAVKGVDEPVRSHLVTGVKPRSFRIGTRGIEGVETRMIGRDAELEALQLAHRRLFDERRLAAVTVVAEAGIGKSRLLHEFEAWSEERPEAVLIFRARATPQTQGQPFGLLRDILAWRFQIADDDALDVARAKLEHGVAPLFIDDDGAELAQGHAHLLGHLIGIEWRDSPHLRGILDDPRQIRNRAFHAAAQLFRRLSARHANPVVLELEDLHWADSESLDFLAYLAEVDRDVPMLMLAFCRPALFERRAHWCAERLHTRIDLTPLGRGSSRALAHELLKKLPEVPAALRELVIGGAEGNPFYMEELVKMLIDQGAIETGEPWRVDAQRLLLTQVPATLTGVLQARLDSLPEPERVTLQQASVIGAVFWDRALLALNDDAGHTLPALVRRELALPRAAASGDDDELREYAFKHQILHQVTYATVLKRTKRQLHGQLAHWLAAQAGLRANDFLAAAARHFELAGDAGNAAEFHARAAEHATTRLAHEAVLEHTQRAFALLADLPEAPARPLRWRLLEAREVTLDMQGERAAQRADIDAMAALADTLGDDRRRAHAAWRLSAWSHRIADHPAMEAAARAAIESAGRAGDAPIGLIAQRMLAMALAFQGRPAEGRAIAEDALAQSCALALHWVEGSCLNALGVIAGMLDDEVGALRFDQQSLAAYRAAGNRRNEAIARGNIGAGWLGLGDFARARSELEEGLRLIRANGDRALEVSPLCALSTLAHWQGDDALALVHAHAALETAVEMQARDQHAAALCRLGDAELALGREAAAAQAFRDAHDGAAAIDSPYRFDAAAGQARVALAQGDAAAALQALAPLLAAGADASLLEGSEFPRLIELSCHRALAAAGDARADAWLARAHTALTAQAERIAEAEVREAFLQQVPHHREIGAAWAAYARSTPMPTPRR